MKSKINLFILIFTLLGLLFSACNKSEDLLTADAKTGGLVIPTANFVYKLGGTPQVDLSVAMPKGPAIVSIEVYNSFTWNSDTATYTSNEILLKTIDAASANLTEDASKSYTLTYTDLIKDLAVLGSALPADESQLTIGSFWTLKYVSVLSDGRKVANNNSTKIQVANQYAGYYQCVGVFHHPTAGDRPINERKFLTPISAYTCNIPAGDLGASGYSVNITVDPATNDVTFSAGAPVEILGSTTERSYFDPANGHFYLHYFYIGSTGARVIDEEYTPE
jgi:hypothetical protein